jgi:ribosomal protein S18 acetylase RimI-like enzyme
MTHWAIEPYRVQDRASLLHLERRIFGRDAFSWGDFQFILRLGPDMFFVARDPADDIQELVGYACGYLDGRTNEGYIASIGVDANVRRQGLGRVLLALLRDKFILAGATTMTLHVRTGNIVAQGLYTRFGFVIERRITHYFPNGPDDGAAFFMRASLTQLPPSTSGVMNSDEHTASENP